MGIWSNQYAALGNYDRIASNFASNFGFLISYPMEKDKTMSNKYGEHIIIQEFDAWNGYKLTHIDDLFFWVNIFKLFVKI